MRDIDPVACNNCGGTKFAVEVWDSQFNFHCLGCTHTAFAVVKDADKLFHQEKSDLEYAAVGRPCAVHQPTLRSLVCEDK